MAIIPFSDFTPGNLTQTVTLNNNRRVVGDAGNVNFTVTDAVAGTTNEFTDNEFVISAVTTEGGLIDLSSLTGDTGTITGDVDWIRTHVVTSLEFVNEDGSEHLALVDTDGMTTDFHITARPNTQTANEIMLANGFDTKVTVVVTIGTDVQTMVLESGQVRVLNSTSGQNAEVSVTLPHTRGGGRGRVDDGERLFAATYLFG